MNRFALLPVVTLAVCLSACGGSGSPTAPIAPASTSVRVPAAGVSPGSTEVRLVDAIAGTPWAGVSVEVDSQAAATSDGDGCATLFAVAGRHAVSFTGPGFVSRTTSILIPAQQVQLSLIPGNFVLAAFDEMFRARDGRLERWMSAPRLVIVGRELRFDPNYASDLTVLPGVVSDAERDQLASDLSDGLAVLTDRQLGPFSSIATESPSPGSSSTILRTGAIVVARSRGLSAATGYWGVGQWATGGSGEVVAGYLLLDADFDGPACAYPQYRRSLRIHELGHALGYSHVTLVQSVMNANARLEPTPWDLQAVRIAFQRPPGSAAPDNDPAPGAAVRSGAWSLAPRMF